MNSKIKNMTKSSVPLKWEGEFDGSVMKESVNTVMYMCSLIQPQHFSTLFILRL